MTQWHEAQATFRGGVLVDAETGVPLPRPEHRVCENTLFAERERERRARLMARLSPHERAVMRRRKHKRGGPK